MSTNTAALTNKKRRDPTGTSAGYKVFAVVILILMTLFFLFPLYWIITGSFKELVEITAKEPTWFPQNPTWENYAELFEHPALRWVSCSPSSSAPWPCPSRSLSFPCCRR